MNPHFSIEEAKVLIYDAIEIINGGIGTKMQDCQIPNVMHFPQ
jgi:hypothetical protein